MEICERDYPFVISDKLRHTRLGTPIVTPAKAGKLSQESVSWIPAFAGMTGGSAQPGVT